MMDIPVFCVISDRGFMGAYSFTRDAIEAANVEVLNKNVLNAMVMQCWYSTKYLEN